MIERLVSLISYYGLFGIFVSMLIENVGIPLPTEGAFLVALNLVSQGRYSFWMMYWFVVASHMIGAVVAYSLGRWFRHNLQHRFAQSKEYVETERVIHRWYERYGSITVLATRLIGYVRPWSSLVAGAAEYPFGPFFFWSLIGTLLFVYPTMRLSALLVVLWQRSPAAHIIISVSIIISLSVVLVLFRILQSRSRQVEAVTRDSSSSERS